MDVEVDRDLRSGVISVGLSGVLNRGSGNEVLAVLLKCAAECPAAVIVDVSGVRLGGDAPPGVFATAFRRSIRGHGVPVLLVAAGTDLARLMAGYRTFVHLYASRAEALQALRVFTPRWRQETLEPVAESAQQARDIVGNACSSWGLTRLRDRARLLTAELVNNAIEHTGRTFHLTVSCTGTYLRLAVQDHSLDPPRLIAADSPGAASGPGARGHGLRLVAAGATHWGTYWLPEGKVVWALLRATPVGLPDPGAGPFDHV